MADNDRGLSLMSGAGNVVPIDPVDSKCATSEETEAARVIRLTLFNHRFFEGSACTGCIDVRATSSRSIDGVTIDDDADQPYSGAAAGYPSSSRPAYAEPSRFDIDLRNPAVWKNKTDKTRKYVLVEVALADPSLSFIAPTNGSTDSSQAVQQGAAHQIFDCRQEIRKNSQNWPYIVFRAKAANVIGSINIGVVVKDDDDRLFTLPVILDPKVPDSG